MRRWHELVAEAFPKPWRDRYGAELSEQLADAGAADRFDLVVAAAAMWGDHVRNQIERTRGLMSMLRRLALALIALGLGSVVWATSELQDGMAELPGHWWSTLATVPLLTGLVLAAVAWGPASGRERRTG